MMVAETRTSGSGWGFRSIGVKLQIAFLAVGLILTFVIGALGYFSARAGLETQDFNNLIALRDTRAEQLDTWFTYRFRDVRAFSANPFVIEAVGDFQEASGDFLEDREAHEIIIDQAKAAYEGQPELVDAGDGTDYSAAHAQYYPILKNYLDTYGYYDIFVIEVDGDVTFTVFKEDDFLTNVDTGIYANTGLGRVYKQALDLPPDGAVFVDFERYAPSDNAPAAFLASPIYDGDELIGVLAFQLPIAIMNSILNLDSGLGETGETYVVGDEYLFHNDSRFLDTLNVPTTILNETFKADTEATRNVFEQNGTGEKIIDNYLGESVLSAWRPVVIQEAIPGVTDGVTWALMAEIDEHEAFATANTLLQFMSIVAVVAAIAIFIVAFILSRQIADPVVQVTAAARRIADGDYSQDLDISSQDEVGILADTINFMANQLRQTFATLDQRSRDIQTVVDVSGQISTILDMERLLQDVVDITKERFALYHAHIYLMDENKQNLTLTAGAGHVGRQMVAEQRVINFNNRQSIVATAARDRKSQVVNNVTLSPNFLAHPLLPDTKSELAVPLVARGQILGTLDVQSNKVDFFDEETLEILEILASQISTALSNAVLYQRSELSSRHEQALSAIDHEIQNAVGVDEMLQTTVRELGKALRVAHTAIELNVRHEQTNGTTKGHSEEVSDV